MFAKDICAGSSLIPGLLGRQTFQVVAKVKNTNYHRAINYDLFVVPVYEGLVSFFGGVGRQTVAPIPSGEAVASAPVSGVSFSAYEAAFGAGLGDIFGKIAKGVGSVLGLIPTPITQAISGVASTVGNLLDKPKSSPTIEIVPPALIPPRLETTGPPIGAPVPLPPNPYASTPNIPVGGPVPAQYLPEYNAYRTAKKSYRRAKKTGTATKDQRDQYKLMQANVRAIKGRRGRGSLHKEYLVMA